MIRRLRFIYIHHFKWTTCLNSGVSIFLLYLFYLKGFAAAELYQLALMFKFAGYGLTIAIEKLFFAPRVYHYKNLGLGYRHILGTFMLLDCLFFTLLVILCYLLKNFI